MKKLIVLFVALAVATGAFAADFSFSWDTDYGWASNFDDEHNYGVDELELAVAADIDDYNTFVFEIEPKMLIVSDSVSGSDDVIAADGSETTYTVYKNIIGMNKMVITTDLGAYLGLSGIGLTWANGLDNLGGDAEYSDFGVVGHNNVGTDRANLDVFASTAMKLTKDAFWLQAASSWNIGVDSSDPATVNADDTRQMQFYAGAVDLVPGLSVEAGTLMELDLEATNVVFDAAYAMDMDGTALTIGGSYAMIDADSSKFTAYESLYGAGAKVAMDLDDMTGVYASVSFEGNDVESFQALGGGAGLTYGDLGAEIAFDYNTTIDAGDAALAGVDIKGFANIGAVTYTVGYVVTDYGWDNSSRAAVPAEGGLYMKVTADF